MKILIKPILIIFCIVVSLSAQERALHRPDSQGIVDFLGSKLNLSENQKEKIKKDIDKKTKEFDSLNKEYIKRIEKIEALKKEADPLAEKMETVYKSLPDVVLKYLDDAQKAKFEELKKPKKRKAKTETQAEPAEAQGENPPSKKIKPAAKKTLPLAEKPKEPDIKEEEPEVLDIFYP